MLDDDKGYIVYSAVDVLLIGINLALVKMLLPGRSVHIIWLVVLTTEPHKLCFQSNWLLKVQEWQLCSQ